MSHNLAVVDYMASEIAVMCRGVIVEQAPRATLFRDPRHPYTQALLAAVPSPDLDHPLDFERVCGGGFSDPGEWPASVHLRAGPDRARRWWKSPPVTSSAWPRNDAAPLLRAAS